MANRPMSIDKWLMSVDNRLMAVDKWLMSVDNRLMSIDKWPMSVDKGPMSVGRLSMSPDQPPVETDGALLQRRGGETRSCKRSSRGERTPDHTPAIGS